MADCYFTGEERAEVDKALSCRLRFVPGEISKDSILSAVSSLSSRPAHGLYHDNAYHQSPDGSTDVVSWIVQFPDRLSLDSFLSKGDINIEGHSTKPQALQCGPQGNVSVSSESLYDIFSNSLHLLMRLSSCLQVVFFFCHMKVHCMC
jgi:hypothetical protein